jgi:hypothetical protein
MKNIQSRIVEEYPHTHTGRSTKGNEKVSAVLILIQYMESFNQWEEINESYIKVNENVG